MKSIFKYYIIIFVNFITLTEAQASQQPPRGRIIATREETPRIIASRQPITPTEELERHPGQSTRHALEHARLLSMRTRTTALPTQEETLLTAPIIDEVSDGHSDHENASNASNSSTKGKLDLARRLSQGVIQHRPSSLTTQQTKREENLQNSTPINRNYFNTLQNSVGALVLALGVWKTFRFFVPSDTQIKRGGVPTDMVGAAFWGASLLSRFASSGLTLVIVAYAGHKAKSTVDGLYENRFNKMLQPVREEIAQLSRYVDDRTNPLAQGQQFLCDVSEEQLNILRKLALLQSRGILIVRTLTDRHATRHPKDSNNATTKNIIEEIITETDEIAQSAHAITEEIEERKKHTSEPPKNPITIKEKSPRCCGGKCSMM